jgi:hypothetical protein
MLLNPQRYVCCSSLRGRANALSVTNVIPSALKLHRRLAPPCDISLKRGDNDPTGSAIEIGGDLARVQQAVDLIARAVEQLTCSTHIRYERL